MKSSAKFLVIVCSVLIIGALTVQSFWPGRGQDNAFNWAIGVGYKCFEFYDKHDEWPKDLGDLAGDDGRIEWGQDHFVSLDDGSVKYSRGDLEISAFDGKNRAMFELSENNQNRWQTAQSAKTQNKPALDNP